MPKLIIFLASILLFSVCSLKALSAQEVPNDIDSVTKGSKWMVSAFENGERLPGFHSVPWTFEADGTVSAGNLWSGNWAKDSSDTIRVAIQDNAGNVDRFQVQFIRGRYFIAFQNGQTYRWGKRVLRATLVP